MVSGWILNLKKKRGAEAPSFYSTISTVKNKSVADRLYTPSMTSKGVV